MEFRFSLRRFIVALAVTGIGIFVATEITKQFDLVMSNSSIVVPLGKELITLMPFAAGLMGFSLILFSFFSPIEEEIEDYEEEVKEEVVKERKQTYEEYAKERIRVQRMIANS